MFKRHPHTPIHLLLDNTSYFITGAIYCRNHLLVEPEIKESLLNLIQEKFKDVDWKLNDWVILDNH